MRENHDPAEQEIIAENLAHVQARIKAAAERAGRDPHEVTLIAVSKTKPLSQIQMAYASGQRHFGENRVQEALGKIAHFQPDAIHWHMIGHVQTNKAGKVAGHFACIHSVDSLHVAQALNSAMEKEHAGQGSALRQPILLQVNVAGESSKSGMSPLEAPSIAAQIAALAHLEIQGLMTVAPIVDDPEQVRPIFQTLRQLRDQLQQQLPDHTWHHLSMGMTDDYPVAIAEGATLVRIGRAIFGTRASKEETRPH